MTGEPPLAGTGRRPDHDDRYATARFQAMYEGSPPWETGRPQPEIVRLAHEGRIRGRVLDVGCGTGENTIHLASLGYDVLGLDAIAKAVEQARAKAAARRVAARFEVFDALALEGLGETFDTVIDSGLFHVFSNEQRPRFVAGLAAVTRPGGVYHMLCFSEHETREGGPRRINQGVIRDSFADGWRIETISESYFEAPVFPPRARAWLASITRL